VKRIERGKSVGDVQNACSHGGLKDAFYLADAGEKLALVGIER
jgi:hypothetical protein